MRKICFVSTIASTLEHFVLGPAIYIHDKMGWDISFICNDDIEFKALLPDYIHYYPVPMKRGISFDAIKAISAIMKIIKREHFDLIQYSTPNASLYTALSAYMCKTPIRLYCQWGMVYVAFSGLKRSLFKLEEKLVCSLSTWVEPDSFSNLAFAHEEGLYPKSKGSVIWNGSANGVNLDKFDIAKKEVFRDEIRNQYRINKDDVVFGFVGRVTRDKGINELLRAYRRFLGKYNNSRLMIVGFDEPDNSVDSDLVKWSQNCPNVIYTGATKHVEKYLSSMDCFILPSYREGFGMVVVEAEAMGLPVIVSNIPGPIDAMKNGTTGILVDKYDDKMLEKAMEELYHNPSLRETYGLNAHKYIVENFDQKRMLEYILADRKCLLESIQ